MIVEGDLTKWDKRALIVEPEQTEGLRQAILRGLMRRAGQLPNVFDDQLLLETFHFWKAGKKDTHRHGPPRKSETGQGLTTEELQAALVDFAIRRAAAPVERSYRRKMAWTLGWLRKQRARKRGRPPADRFALAVLTARYTAPGSPGRKNPHAIAVRMIEDGAYNALEPRKLEGLIGEILRPPPKGE
jgi:hypothetical protein